jgi:hypothetical protein
MPVARDTGALSPAAVGLAEPHAENFPDPTEAGGPDGLLQIRHCCRDPRSTAGRGWASAAGRVPGPAAAPGGGPTARDGRIATGAIGARRYR